MWGFLPLRNRLFSLNTPKSSTCGTLLFVVVVVLASNCAPRGGGIVFGGGGLQRRLPYVPAPHPRHALHSVCPGVSPLLHSTLPSPPRNTAFLGVGPRTAFLKRGCVRAGTNCLSLLVTFLDRSLTRRARSPLQRLGFFGHFPHFLFLHSSPLFLSTPSSPHIPGFEGDPGSAPRLFHARHPRVCALARARGHSSPIWTDLEAREKFEQSVGFVVDLLKRSTGSRAAPPALLSLQPWLS